MSASYPCRRRSALPPNSSTGGRLPYSSTIARRQLGRRAMTRMGLLNRRYSSQFAETAHSPLMAVDVRSTAPLVAPQIALLDQTLAPQIAKLDERVSAD